jgi:hypothetical protein
MYWKSRNLVFHDEGIERATKIGSALLKWEDVVRCDSFRRSLNLFFKNGEQISVPSEAKGFGQINAYSWNKLEEIGSFEDGRKVPHVLFSISYLNAFLFLAAIGLLVTVVIKLTD